jgi:Phosphotransferase enzyme family
MIDRRAQAIVAASIASWASPLEETLFGTNDPQAILRLLDDFCNSVLGHLLATVTFYRRGVGAVFGVVLGDGRRVVIKVHRPELVGDSLHGIRQVQQHLADLGLPAPRPLGNPIPLGRGLATAEEMLDRGRAGDAHNPGVRRDLVRGLRTFVEAAMPLLGTVRLGLAPPFGLPPGRLWPLPHAFRFDFGLSGAEWIDEPATEARSTLSEPRGAMVIGHMDWRVENLRFDEGLAAIFDWDSVARSPEPALVGKTAASFTSSWEDGACDPYPSGEEVSAFVADYELARGLPFTSDERKTADAAYTYSLAYHARCEHSDATLGVFPDMDAVRGWRSLLRSHPRLGT